MTRERPSGEALARSVERWLNEAEQDGELTGLRAGLARVLKARDLTLSEFGGARVATCNDVDILIRYLDRATTATCEAEVFEGGNVGERLVTQGFAQGYASRQPTTYAPGLQLAIGAILGKRCLPLSESGRARVEACADVATLTRWLTRAVTASSEGDVFSGEGSVTAVGRELT